MLRLSVVFVLVLAGAVLTVPALLISPWWWAAAVPVLALAALGVHDAFQRRHSVLRNYPLIGRLRYLLESVRPEMQQYFVERNYDGRPYDRDVRNIVYERAKGTEDEAPFGSERDMYGGGYEFLVPSMAPKPVPDEPPTVRIGGPDCTRRTTWHC